MENNSKPSPPLVLLEASLGRRWGAFLIDHFILSFVFLLSLGFWLTNIMDERFNYVPAFLSLSVSGLLFARPSGFFYTWGENFYYTSTLLFFLFNGVPFLVYVVRDAFNGQSIGKRICGIGVRNAKDHATVPSIPRLFLRQIFSFSLPIEFIAMIFNGENQKLGDKMAETGVYNLKKESHHPTPFAPYKPENKKIINNTVTAIFVLLFVLGSLVFGASSLFKYHFSYFDATNYIRANAEITALIGEVESFGFMPMGNLNISPGHGDANFNIRAIGPYGEVRAFVEIQQRGGGGWEVVQFSFVQIR